MTRHAGTSEFYRWLLAPACALIVACGGAERLPSGDWRASYDTIGDTVVVRTESGSVWGEEGSLVGDLTIGELEGPDEYTFGRIVGLAVAPDGAIYALDRQAMALRKYAPDGTYMATFGREGGGPGEYRAPDGGLAVLPDGRVLLRDPGNTRINVYSPEGEPLDSWRIRGGFTTSRGLQVDTAGNAYTPILLDPEADLTNFRTALVRFAGDGQPLDTLAAPEWDYEPPQLVARLGGRSSGHAVPFAPYATWTFSPRGYFVGGVTTRYAIDLYKPDGVLRIEREYDPVPVLPEEKADHERRVTAMLRQVDRSWSWNGPPVPDTKPPYRILFIGQDGRIWARLYQEAHEVEAAAEERPGAIPELRWEEPYAFDVFEPDGRYLGMVRAPDGFSISPRPIARRDTVWAVVHDDMDVPYITRFHIELGAPGAT